MMTRRTKEIPAVKYDPDVETERRADDRPRDAKWGLLFRTFSKPTEIAVLVAAVFGAAGLINRCAGAPAAIAQEASARVAGDTALRGRTERNSARLDTVVLSVADLTKQLTDMKDRQVLTNYMLCELAKATHSTLAISAQRDCTAIIQKRLAP